jgi:predicted nucleic acid-binding protein
VLLADTSAWIEFLRSTGSPQSQRMREAISRREVVVIDPVALELMGGARRAAVNQTQRLLDAQHHEALAPRLDWLDGAAIYRELRWRGITVRSQIDALIAAVAIRLQLPVLHRDRNYSEIADHTMLQLVEL